MVPGTSRASSTFRITSHRRLRVQHSILKVVQNLVSRSRSACVDLLMEKANTNSAMFLVVVSRCDP